MRLTVGPLPPAVYWRRRAVVLGAILLFVLVMTYSCAKSDPPSTSPRAAEPTGAPQNPAPSVTIQSSPTGAPAGTGDVSPPAASPTGAGTEPTVAAAQPTGEPAAATDPGTCTDDEITVAATPAQDAVAPGAQVEISLQIKNVSKRTCTRDLGSLQQELYLKLGAQKVWSSDTCSTGKDSDVKSMEPNIVHQYQLTWNGRDSTKCAGGVASGPYAAPGSYLLFGRVGSKLSEPAPLSITG
jgi:hypothetical protein